MNELRRHERASIDASVRYSVRGSNETGVGRARDISLGGMFIVTEQPLPFATEIVIHVMLPGHKSEFALPCVVRWVGGGGMGVQFGLIGARETHAITELVK